MQKSFPECKPAPLPTALIDLSYPLLRDALPRLLEDKTTGRNIVWATDSYAHLGAEFASGAPITLEALDKLGDEFRPRVLKRDDERRKRSKERAEVFTPARICAMMNDFCDQDWFGRNTPIFTKTTEDGWETVEGKILFPKKRNWLQYVDSRRLEITCGEAPFIVSRYDAATGDYIPVKAERRVGALDRKLRVIAENTTELTKDEWLNVALRAFQSVYGYEYQGDSLLIARINVLMTLLEYYTDRFEDRDEFLSVKEIAKFANVIAWNFWQMDGLTCKSLTMPKEHEKGKYFGNSFLEEGVAGTTVKVFNWRDEHSYQFGKTRNKGERRLNLDYVIGNPPYQEAVEGTSDRPVYNYFMDAVYEVADKVLLITPARFLFRGRKTPMEWNEKMLSDPHLKVEVYEPNSSTFFSDNDIKGGIVITYRDKTKEFGAIEAFFVFKELESLYKKVVKTKDFKTIDDTIAIQIDWDLDNLYLDYPNCKKIIGLEGKRKALTSPIFTQIPVFTETGGVTIISKFSA